MSAASQTAPASFWRVALPVILSGLGMAAVNVVVVVWQAASIATQVTEIGRRLERIEGRDEMRSGRMTEIMERLARIEGRQDFKRNQTGAN